MPKVFFIATMNNAVAYYRMAGFIQKMSEMGLVNSRLFPQWEPEKYEPMFWEGEFEKHLPGIEETVDWADMVVCQYVSTPMGVSVVEGIRDMKPCFMECDDYFAAVPEYSGAFHDNKPGDRQDYWATRQLMESTGVVTPTTYLKDFFSKYNRKIKVIPNCIDFNLWNHTEKKEKDTVNIGWVGGGSHAGDLKIVKGALYRILKKYPQATVTIACGQPLGWEPAERLTLKQVGVPIIDYPKMVKGFGFDIGIAPLRDNYFNRGKSNLRYLEYSAMGIPTVASPTEPFKKDFTGMLANAEEEWFSILSNLIEDRNFRKSEGERAYQHAYENFNLDTVSKDYANFIEEVLNAKS